MEMTAQQTADLLIKRISAYGRNNANENKSLDYDLRQILNDNADAVINDNSCLNKNFAPMYFIPDPDIVKTGSVIKERESIIKDAAYTGSIIDTFVGGFGFAFDCVFTMAMENQLLPIILMFIFAFLLLQHVILKDENTLTARLIAAIKMHQAGITDRQLKRHDQDQNRVYIK